MEFKWDAEGTVTGTIGGSDAELIEKWPGLLFVPRQLERRALRPDGRLAHVTRSMLASMLPAYREYRPPVDLEPVVACLWENEPEEDRVQRVVPDGCVDLIWLAERELVIAGADTGPRSVDLPAGIRLSGIRLRPGAAGAVLGLPASELRDRQVAVVLVWGEQGARLQQAVAGAAPRGDWSCWPTRCRGVAPSRMRWCSPPRGGSPFPGRVSRASRPSSGLASVSSTDGCSPLWDTGPRCLPGLLACEGSRRSWTIRWYRERSRPATRAKRT